jgi:hypothetical protein
MRTKVAVLALLGAPLLFMSLAHGPALAAPAPGVVNAVGSGTPDASLVLVRSGSGGGGGHFSGGGMGGGGGMGHMGGGGMGHIGGGSMGHIGAGGMSHIAGHVGGGLVYGGGRHFAGTGSGVYHGHAYAGPRYANRDDLGARHGRYGNHYDNRHYAERGHDHGHYYRHRVYRNGAWVWVYGPGYYYGPDYYAYGGECYWLRQQAYATGSPYWWSRYNACLGYY